MEKMMKKQKNSETKRVSTDVEETMDESKVAKRLLNEQINKIIDSSKMVKWPEEEKKDDQQLQAIQKQQARASKQEAVDSGDESESSTDTEIEDDFHCIQTENQRDYDENVDDLKEDINIKESKPDSSDDVEDNLKDNERTDDSEADLNIAGPSTSTDSVSMHQIAKSSKGPKGQTGPKAVTTVPLRIITQKLKCTVPGCTKVVKSRKSLKRHLLSSHQFKEYRCLMRRCHDQKSASFSTRSELTTHRRQVHGNLSNWTCICSKKFVTYAELHTHYWLNHELGHFVCSAESCTFRSTSTRASVEAHQRCHDETLKYQCPVDGCSGRFKRKGDLDKHTLIHSGKRSFLCPECDKPFNQKGDLTVHLRIHLNDKCYHCTWPQCAHSATNRSAVLQHIRLIHFQLPRTMRQQLAKGIKDARDARQYLRKV